VKDKQLVTYNSRDKNGIVVHDSNDKPKHYYKRCAKGLYCNDMSVINHATTLARISTVAKNEAEFSNHEITRVKEARKFQEIAGLSLEGLLNDIDNGNIQNNPITRR